MTEQLLTRRGLLKLAFGTLVGAKTSSWQLAAAAELKNLDMVVVGDNGVGKTSLLITYTTGVFPEHIPSVFDQYSTNAFIGNDPYRLTFWDHAASGDILRQLSSPQTRAVLLCYDVAARASFRSVTRKWAASLAKHSPKVPFLLVGCKQDLRGRKTKGPAVVRTAEGDALARRIGAKRFVECSSLTQEGLKNVIEQAVLAATGQML